MPTLFAHLKYPPRRHGPATVDEFRKHYTPGREIPISAIGYTSIVFGGLIGIGTYDIVGLFYGIITGVGVAWTIFSGVFFLTYAASCCDYGGGSLVWLPWRQWWVWTFFVFTLPWIVFWLISLLRLTINHGKERPEPLPIDY